MTDKKTGKPPAQNNKGPSTHRNGGGNQGENATMNAPASAAAVKTAPESPTVSAAAPPQAGAAPQTASTEQAKPATPQSAQATAAAAGANTATAFGQAVWLHMAMPAFKHIFLADLEWMVLPPIMLGQYRILFEQGRPLAFSAWASLSAEAEARLMGGNPRLAPAEWKSGDRLWLVSLVAPMGHTDKALEDVKFNGLAGKSFKYHRRFPDGRAVVETVQG